MPPARQLKVILGATAGVAAAIGIFIARRSRRPGLDEEREDTERTVRAELEGAGEDYSDVRVTALAPGIVELTGSVETDALSRDAASRVQSVEGVRTVVNRLSVGEEEARLADTRERRESGAPELQEHQWYGQRVGTGRRRQSAGTDPDRADDKVPMVSRDLGTDRAQEQASEQIENQAPAVEGHTTAVPASNRASRASGEPDLADARPPHPSAQEQHGTARVHEDVPPGVELALEASGLAGNEDLRADTGEGPEPAPDGGAAETAEGSPMEEPRES